MESILDTIEKPSGTNDDKEQTEETNIQTQIPTRLAEVVVAPVGESAASPIQVASGNPPMPVAVPATEIEVPVPTQEDVPATVITETTVTTQVSNYST